MEENPQISKRSRNDERVESGRRQEGDTVVII
jgi:hypothetical protein